MTLTNDDIQKIGQLFDTRLKPLEDKIERTREELQSGLGKVEDELQEVKFKVTKIDIYVESEIRVNIQRVAEGHLDLSRKLNDCIRLSNEVKARQEIQDVYLNMHEAKLKAM